VFLLNLPRVNSGGQCSVHDAEQSHFRGDPALGAAQVDSISCFTNAMALYYTAVACGQTMHQTRSGT
jgi:hypothetical protein